MALYNDRCNALGKDAHVKVSNYSPEDPNAGEFFCLYRQFGYSCCRIEENQCQGERKVREGIENLITVLREREQKNRKRRAV